eukprot:evm.model.scf_18.1 EVM.evm.TU.scf_18.1   scf_18:1430-1732(-)
MGCATGRIRPSLVDSPPHWIVSRIRIQRGVARWQEADQARHESCYESLRLSGWQTLETGLVRAVHTGAAIERGVEKYQNVPMIEQYQTLYVCPIRFPVDQ